MAAYTMLLGASPGLVRVVYSSNYDATTTSIASSVNTPTTVSSVTYTEKSSTDYTVMWMESFLYGSVTLDFVTTVAQGASSTVIYNSEPQDTTDVLSHGGSFAYTGTGSSTTWNLQHHVETGGAVTASAYAKNILALEHISVDRYNGNAGTATFTNGGYTLPAITVPAAGNYLILATSAVLFNTASATDFVRIIERGNSNVDWGTGYPRVQDNTNYSPYVYSGVHTLTTLNNSNISVSGSNTGSATTGNMRTTSLSLFPLSGFPNVYYRNQTNATTLTSTTASTTSTTFVAANTATFNIVNPNNRHLLIATAFLSNNSTTLSASCRLTDGSTTDYGYTWLAENPPGDIPVVIVRVLTFASATQTFQWEFKSETASTTSVLKDANITLLDLGAP